MKTKRRTKDADEVEEDMKPQNAKKLLNQEVDYDQTGNAQFYCLHCAWVVIAGSLVSYSIYSWEEVVSRYAMFGSIYNWLRGEGELANQNVARQGGGWYSLEGNT